MSNKHPSATLVRILSVIILVVLAVLPFHAFLAVWLSTIVGHYTALRLWKEVLLAILVIKCGWMLAKDTGLRRQVMHSRLMQLIGVYTLVQLIWGAVAFGLHDVGAKAVAYGLLLNLRFLAFFVVVWILASRSTYLQRNWKKVIILPAVIVIIIGLLQFFVLPYDFLKHLGYGANTIFPYEDINHNTHYIRVMSTLRGANPLGAYLVLVLSLLLAIWKKQKKEWPLAILPAAGFLALILTFSRSAWIGMVLSTAVILWTMLKTERARRLSLVGGGIFVLLAAGIGFGLRHNTTFENTFFHTQEHSTVATTSNAGHASALKSGVKDLVHQPLGRGPGSAGPASVYNNHPARIAENYFVQIGQETGWIGLVLFAAINVYLGRELWRRRTQPLALGLFAALIGISFINLLSHAWTDDTLAYIFWGLAGIALATEVIKPKAAKHEV